MSEFNSLALTKCSRCGNEAPCQSFTMRTVSVLVCAACLTLVVFEWAQRKTDFRELQTS